MPAFRAPPNKPMEPTSLALALRHVPVASWARRRAAVAVLRSGRGSSASRQAAHRGATGLGAWRSDLEAFLVDEYKDAVDSVIALRNTISHGRFVGLTMTRVRDYYGRVGTVVDHIADLCVP